jgi:hypothetical protein
MSGRRKRLSILPGDRVLIGTPGISMPGDWFAAYVLWADDSEALIEHAPPCRTPPIVRQVVTFCQIRAIGRPADLVEFKERARAAVKEQQDKVRECESALTHARDAVWAKLDEIAAAKPKRLSASR